MRINQKILRLTPAVIYFCLIWYLSSRQITFDLSGNDKLIHLVEYTGMGFLLAFGFEINFENLKQNLKGFLLIAPLTGAIDEIHQAYVPGRNASTADFIVDVIGCAIGLVFFLILVKFLKRHAL